MQLPRLKVDVRAYLVTLIMAVQNTQDEEHQHKLFRKYIPFIGDDAASVNYVFDFIRAQKLTASDAARGLRETLRAQRMTDDVIEEAFACICDSVIKSCVIFREIVFYLFDTGIYLGLRTSVVVEIMGDQGYDTGAWKTNHKLADYYAVLGLARTATFHEVATVFRQEVEIFKRLELHSLSENIPSAAQERFEKITDAYAAIRYRVRCPEKAES
ncbi:hypothetical protein [Shinella zoogloeoides]|uniref:J domain-containing protein n=1 Tax=Shinella zoogloeoides TaxID=352475 RepID=A0A6N8TH86_SHIZO|nr:hypothetical protein [Shinella zoogloeoides]MXO02637.1 hypothetical protein [Shinella zoogloeoides]UEX80168.1 hypothetical protein K8M09_11045 [Shinella zoogloeoides]